MKKVGWIVLLFLGLIGCKIDTAETETNENSDNKDVIPTYANGIVIDDITYEKTGEILVMKNEITIEGSSSRNHYDCFRNGRTVTLSPFYMCKYEITQELYDAVMQGQIITIDGKDYVLNSRPSGYVKLKPVFYITWYDAIYFCNILNEKIGLEKCYNIEIKKIERNHITDADVSFIENTNGYRLPTIHERQFVARGADPAGYWWDKKRYKSTLTIDSDTSFSKVDSSLDEYCWYKYNSGDSNGISDENSKNPIIHEVGLKKADSLGLYDIYGNVYEWCFDSPYDDGFYLGTFKNPVKHQLGDLKKIVAGESYNSEGSIVQCFGVAFNKIYASYTDVGIRLCRSYFSDNISK